MSDLKLPPSLSSGPTSVSLVGDIVAERFLVHRLLGRGGMGAVYEAEHIHMKKRVALKVLHSQFSTHPEARARFEREAILAARLEHPGIVTARDFGQLRDGSFYLALDFVDGDSLSKEIERHGPFSVTRAFGIAVQITAALGAAHEAGIVHRDLKPDNVMLAATSDSEDFVKVLDFGIAKMNQDALTDRPGITRAGAIFGTPEYMSPEQARGDTVDHRSDLYAVGMILYEMLSGAPAFRYPELMATLTAQIADPPPPLPEGVPEPLARLVLQLLAKDPAARPGGADELMSRLTAIGATLGIPLPAPRIQAGTRLNWMPKGSPQSLYPGRPSLPARGLASLQALSMRPVPIAGRQVPLLVPVLALLLGLTVGGLTIHHRYKKAQASAASAHRALAAEERLIASARAGDSTAVQELRRALEAQRSSVVGDSSDPAAGGHREHAAKWAALGAGLTRLGRRAEAIRAYQTATQISAEFAQDPDLQRDTRAALDHEDSLDEALAFCQAELRAVGADLIYDAWHDSIGVPGRSAIVARTGRLLRDPTLNAKSSPALQIALALEQAQSCRDFLPLIPRARAAADERSLAKLRALEAKQGCGERGTEDCFACLHTQGVPLAEAIQEASRRPGPSALEGTSRTLGKP